MVKIRRAFDNMIWPAILACVLYAAGAAPAAAQAVGDPLSIVAEAEGGTAIIAAVSFGPGQREAIDALAHDRIDIEVGSSPGASNILTFRAP